MFILGICESHDAAVCLLEDGQVRAAIALERILRVKHGLVSDPVRASATHRAIEYCLEVAGIRWDDVDLVCGVSPDANSREYNEALMRRLTGVPQRDKVVVMPHPAHHLAHAYSAFCASGFPSAAALVVDCYGSVVGEARECETGFAFPAGMSPPERVLAHTKPIRLLAHHEESTGLCRIPETLSGVGELYRTITMLLGFYHQETSYDEAGKTMGLAPYGRLLSREPVMLRPIEGGAIDYSGALPWLESRGLVVRASTGKLYLAARRPSTPLSQLHKDLAAQIQWELEEACLHMARHLQERTGEARLVLAGGVFLNAVANQRLATETRFEEVYPFPAATDDGTAIGAAYFAYHEACRRQGRAPARVRLRNACLGATHGEEAVGAAVARCGLPYRTVASPEAAAEEAGRLLAGGKVVGWFQGGSEFGPRALGNRSILADPRVRDIKDVLNSRVKFREGFRPFAPAVLAERAEEYFVMVPKSSPFMLFVLPVVEAHRDLMPGITHVDGTARVQTVAREDHPLFHALITSFARQTGLPVVLNTSFNLRGMPIVETPEDALHCFLLNEMDYLVMDRFVLPAPDFAGMVPVRAELELMLRGHWGAGAAEVVAPDRVRLSAPGGSAEVASPLERTILEAMDGRRTVAEIGAQVGLDQATAIRRVLELCRRRWCRWQGIGAGLGARSPLLLEGGRPA